MIKIKHGFDIPLSGAPEQVIHTSTKPSQIGLTNEFFQTRKPQFAVKLGDSVQKGQVLFVDKQIPDIKFVSPVTGIVSAINRGDKRVFLSIVIDVDQDSDKDQIEFTKYDLATLDAKQAKDQLLNSGLWTTIRQRPFENIANPQIEPTAIFVNAADTNPGAAKPSVIINENEDSISAFEYGLGVLSKAFNCKKFLVSQDKLHISNNHGFTEEKVSGPHPAGLVGTHINHLCPTSVNHPVFHINYQDVIAIGKLFKTGKLDSSVVVAISGPKCSKPALYRTIKGVKLSELTANLTAKDKFPIRIISGSVLNGTKAQGAFDFLAPYSLQVTLIEDNEDQRFLGWVLPQPTKVSISHLSYFGKKNVPLNTSTNGSKRSLMPIGFFEKVFPLDMYITLLLRDILAGDTDSAQSLGVNELAEEDLALCTFVCTGKNDYGYLLRNMLNKIEKEG